MKRSSFNMTCTYSVKDVDIDDNTDDIFQNTFSPPDGTRRHMHISIMSYTTGNLFKNVQNIYKQN